MLARLQNTRHPHDYRGNAEWRGHLGRRFGRLRTKQTLTLDPTVVLLSVDPIELEACVHTKLARTFIVTRNWK